LEIDAAFEKLTRLNVGGLAISADSFFLFHAREQLAAPSARYALSALSAMFGFRQFAFAGGLTSCGAGVNE
jgi:hypothetical protein